MKFAVDDDVIFIWGVQKFNAKIFAILQYYKILVEERF